MKNILALLFLFQLIVGCKTQEIVPVKENPPVVVTKPATDISLLISTLNGEVLDEGFTAVTDRGFVYSDKNTNPSVNDSKIQSGLGKGLYSIKIDNLLLNTKYNFKAYAANSKGISYGEVQSFTTLDAKLPTAITDVPLNITFYSADLSGSITDDGGAKVTERGFCYGLNPNPTILDNKVISGEGLGVIKITPKNLKDNSKYYFRTYAINSKGTVYGNEQTFTTLLPPITPRDNNTKVVEVISKTGRIWMDRNLGALQVATSNTDVNSYGDLYQWGRGIDGHQLRTSGTTNTVSTTDSPGNDKFILPNTNPFDWRSTQTPYLWQGVNGVNNPCPNGYRLPTDAEWNDEFRSWSGFNSNGAFASPLKLPLGGFRNEAGIIENVGGLGQYWSSTTQITGELYPQALFFGVLFVGAPNSVGVGSTNRAKGNCVRCIKN